MVVALKLLAVVVVAVEPSLLATKTSHWSAQVVAAAERVAVSVALAC